MCLQAFQTVTLNINKFNDISKEIKKDFPEIINSMTTDENEER